MGRLFILLLLVFPVVSLSSSFRTTCKEIPTLMAFQHGHSHVQWQGHYQLPEPDLTEIDPLDRGKYMKGLNAEGIRSLIQKSLDRYMKEGEADAERAFEALQVLADPRVLESLGLRPKNNFMILEEGSITDKIHPQGGFWADPNIYKIFDEAYFNGCRTPPRYDPKSRFISFGVPYAVRYKNGKTGPIDMKTAEHRYLVNRAYRIALEEILHAYQFATGGHPISPLYQQYVKEFPTSGVNAPVIHELEGDIAAVFHELGMPMDDVELGRYRHIRPPLNQWLEDKKSPSGWRLGS